MKKLIVLIALAFGAAVGAANYAFADTLDAGIGSGSAIVTAPTASDPSTTELAKDVYDGIARHDWFLVAGGALCLLVIGVRYLLAKKWPKFADGGIYGVAVVAALAGLGALGNAWIADERLASTTTLLGALKVWAAAVFAYVTAKQLLGAKAKEPTAS